MKFLAFSDIHAHNFKSFAKYSSGVNSRLQSIIDCIHKIQEIGNNHKVDFYLFCGDLFHTQGYVENSCYNKVFDAFRKFSRPVYCVAGNHDNYKSRNSSDVSFLSFQELDNIVISEDNDIYDLKRGILGFGYRDTFNVDEIVEEIKAKKEIYPNSVIILHQIPVGCSDSFGHIYNEGIDWKHLEEHAKLILFGHIHKPQKLSDKTYIIGAPLAQNFSDIGDRGVWIFDIDDTVDAEFISLDFPKFITVDKVTNEIRDDNKNYYRVIGEQKQIGEDNVLFTGKEKEAFEKREIVTSKMSVESIIEKYLVYKNIDNKEYSDYGVKILREADSECQPIYPSNFSLRKISIEGFMSFKEKSEYEFKDGVWLVLGESDIFSSNGCIIGDTLIDVPRNYSTDYWGVPIKELVGKEFFTYSYDLSLGRFVLRKAYNVRKTGEKVPVYKVTYRSSSHWGKYAQHFECILATKEHRFLLTNGEYKELQYLSVGDSLRSLYKKMPYDGYWHIRYSDDEPSTDYEHKFILKEMYEDKKDCHGHHKDLNKFNNSIDNLEYLSAKEHLSKHLIINNPMHDEKVMKTWIHPRGMLGKKHLEETRSRISNTVKEGIKNNPLLKEKILTGLRKAVENKKNPLDKALLYELYINQEKSAVDIGRILSVSDVHVKNQLVKYGIPLRTLSEVQRNYYKHKVLNHIVESVEFYGYEDVYDMEVENTHNFVANGIVIHNSGKTSIFDSIFWCLYGKTTKDLAMDDVVNDILGKNCRVTCELYDEKDSRIIVVDRFRKYDKLGNGFRLIDNGVEVEGTPKVIEKRLFGILGFDYDFFLNTVYYSQEKTQFFAGSTDSTKKSFLDIVLQIEKYNIALKNVRKDLSVIDESMNRNMFIREEGLKTIKNKEECLPELISQEEVFETERKKALENISLELGEIRGKVSLKDLSIGAMKKEYNAKFDLLQSIDKELRHLIQELNDKKNALLEAKTVAIQDVTEKYNTHKNIILNKIYLHKQELEEKYNEEKNLLLNKLTALKTSLREIISRDFEIEVKIDSIKISEGKCDKCGADITEESKERFLEEWILKRKEITQEVQNINKKSPIVEQEIDLLQEEFEQEVAEIDLDSEKELEELKITFDSGKNKALDIYNNSTKKVSMDFNRKIEQKNKEKNDLSNECKKIQACISDEENIFRRLSNEVSNLEKENIKIERRENEYTTKIKSIKEYILEGKKEIEKASKNLEKLYIDKCMIEFWESGFNNGGIKSLLIDEFCMIFNKEIRKHIADISDGKMTIEMTTQTKLGSGELREKIDLTITLQNLEKRYNQLSGGEKRRVDISIIVTLNNIIRDMYNIQLGLLGILILDEVFSFLDDVGEENVYFLLQSLSSKVKSIYVITHTDELKSYFENCILIKKLGQEGSKIILK